MTQKEAHADDLSVTTHASDATARCGQLFARILRKGDVVLMTGDLGAGKTTFVKGVAQGLGFRGRVLSPSFTLAREYEGKKMQLNHLDLYRLRKKELEGSLLDDYWHPTDAVTMIEWGEKAEDIVGEHMVIEFFLTGKYSRRIVFHPDSKTPERIEKLRELYRKEKL